MFFSLSLFLTGCGGNNDALDKAQIRYEVNSLLNRLINISEDNLSKRLSIISDMLTDDFKYIYTDKYGYTSEFTKNEYLDLLSLSYSTGDISGSSQIINRVINVKSSVYASMTAKQVNNLNIKGVSYRTEALLKLSFKKIKSSWYLSELRSVYYSSQVL